MCFFILKIERMIEMSSFNLENSTAIQGNGNNIPVIGHLTWYSLAEQMYSREDIRQGLINSGLDEHWLPPVIRLPDAFRRATSAVECRRVSDQEGKHYNYLIREVAYDATFIQRNIVMETVDRAGKRLEYNPEAAILTLDKEQGTINIQVLSKNAEDITKEALRLFELFKNHYNSQMVRGMIHRIHNSLAPISVKPSGGIYFIPIRFESTLKSLCHFIQGLDNGFSHSIKVINDAESRDMVRDNLLAHLKGIYGGCHNSLKEDVPKGKIKAILEGAKNAINDFKEYEVLLSDEVNNMQTYIELIKQQVSLLLNKIE